MIRLFAELGRLGWLSPRTTWHFIRSGWRHGQTICSLLRTTAMLFPKRIALSDGTTRLSFAEQYDKVLRLSAVIGRDTRMKGIQTVLFACANTIDHVLLLYALQNAGIRVILLHAKAHPADIERIRRQYGDGHLLLTDEAVPGTVAPFLHTEEWRIAAVVASASTEYASTKPAQVVFPTSGTTGRPKLIEKKPGFLYWLGAFTDLVTTTGIHRCKAVFVSLPIAHGFGYTSLLFSLVLGKKAVLNVHKEPGHIAGLMVKEEVDLLAGVPASLFQLAQGLAGKPHGVKLIITGGAALTEPVWHALRENLTPNIYGLYGSTESSTSFLATPADLQKNVHALGRPLRGVRYRIDALADGGGELVICSPMANIDPCGWRHTGDLVARDGNGLLYWCGRKDDMIIRNGVNIYPVEIETALLKLPGIAEAIVCGEADAQKGEAVMAFVKMDQAQVFREEEILQRLRELLAGNKLPDRVVEVREIKYNSVGKRIRPTLGVGP